MIKQGDKVVVTTLHKGVFFGTLACDPKAKIIELEGARNCIYWDRSVEGFVGLAKKGPIAESKVGPECEVMELRDITSVLKCSDEAVAQWDSK